MRAKLDFAMFHAPRVEWYCAPIAFPFTWVTAHDAVMGESISFLSWSFSWEISVTVVCHVHDCSVFIRFCCFSVFPWSWGVHSWISSSWCIHSSSKGKCPALLAVKQFWVQPLFRSRLVFLLFLSNELVNLNEKERDKLLLSRAWVLLAGTWTGGICRAFNWHLPVAAANFHVIDFLFGL